MFPQLSRRQVLKSASAGFGYVALAGLLGQQAKASAPGPLSPREPHFPVRAKRIIFVFMEGAMSQLDRNLSLPVGSNCEVQSAGSARSGWQHGAAASCAVRRP